MSTETQNPAADVPVNTTGGFDFDAFKDTSLLNTNNEEHSTTDTGAQPEGEQQTEVPSGGENPAAETAEESGSATPSGSSESTGVKIQDTPKGEIPVDFGQLERPNYPEKRDYTGIDGNHVKFFKNMKNESFAALKPIYEEWKKLKAEVPTYQTKLTELEKAAKPLYHYDHPEAYSLSQDYTEARNNYATADQLLNHVSQQLINHETGDKWTPVFVDDQGQIRVGQPQEPTPESKAQLLQSISRLESLKSEYRGKMEGAKATFATGRQGAIQQIKDFQTKAFPHWPKLTEPQKAEYKTLYDGLPPHLKNSDYGEVTAQAIYTAHLAMQKVAALMKQVKVNQTNGAQQRTAATIKGGTAGGPLKKSPFDLSDFDELKRSR